jgi:hypothetical protein
MEIDGIYNKVQTFYFPLVDFGATDFESTPVTFATGDVQVSIDGGNFANANATCNHEGNGIYSWVCTAAEVTGTRIVVTIIDQTDPKAWEDQCIIINTQMTATVEAGQGIIIGQVNNTDFTATTTALESDRQWPNTTEETTADHFIGKLICFTSGDARGEISDITDYSLANSREKYTYTAIVTTPSANDRFCII